MISLAIWFFIFELQTAMSWSFSPITHHIDPQSIASRRDVFQKAISFGSIAASVSIASITSLPSPAQAASLPTTDELEKLRLGHARVQYLLDHWDEVTRICGTTIMSDTERKQVIRTEGGGGTDSCTKNPLRVQEFMGYKSINDPLYKADKLMVRASPLVDPDQFENYVDVVERYREKADSTSLLAYTSSWGEANP
jgi:hypothetical protein